MFVRMSIRRASWCSQARSNASVNFKFIHIRRGMLWPVGASAYRSINGAARWYTWSYAVSSHLEPRLSVILWCVVLVNVELVKARRPAKRGRKAKGAERFDIVGWLSENRPGAATSHLTSCFNSQSFPIIVTESCAFCGCREHLNVS